VVHKNESKKKTAKQLKKELAELHTQITILEKVKTQYKVICEEMKRVIRLITIIRSINQILLKATSEQVLFDQICRLIKKIDYVKFVWIGLVKKGSFEVHPVVWAGRESGYLSSIRVTWDDSEYGKGPVGTAVKTGELSVVMDIESDPLYLPWKKEAVKRGYASTIALPLKYQKEVIGILQIYTGEKFAFGDEEIHSLEEVASDIAVGVKSLRIEKSLKESEERFRLLTEAVQDYAIFMLDREGHIASWNSGAQRITHYRASEVINKHFSCFYTREDVERAQPEQLLKIAIEKGRSDNECWRVRRDGSCFWAHVVITALRDKRRNLIGFSVVTRDITERKRAEESLERVNRALAVLSECNQRLVRASDESQLLQEICHVTVKEGDYRMAWVGFADQDEKKTVRPVAQAGFEDGYLNTIDISWANSTQARNPTGTAIRTGKPFICKKIATVLQHVPWRSEAVKRGYASVISLPLCDDGHTFGALNIYSAEPNAFDEEEVKRLRELADDLAYGITTLRTRTERRQAQEDLKQSFKKLQKTLEGVIHAMALTVETRDPYTAGHQHRVAALASTIGKEMGLTKDEIRGIYMAGVTHDLGKICIPAEILSKPSQLTDFEFGIIKTHPRVGYDILKKIDFPWPVADIVLQHHERMNGSGYPQGLSGDEILKEAKILGVADVIEAMAFHRPYRPARGIGKALKEISKNRGILYDPQVVDACLKLFTEKKFRFK
jgi:PAS domain S-box-containing protein